MIILFYPLSLSPKKQIYLNTIGQKKLYTRYQVLFHTRPCYSLIIGYTFVDKATVKKGSTVKYI